MGKTLLAANMFSICLLILAGFMMYNHVSGAGWVVFGAIICAYGPKTTDKED